MSLYITNHYPSINATGIYRNDSVKVKFNKPIRSSSVEWSVMSVHDADTFSNVVGDLGVIWDSSGNVTGVYFTPEVNYTANSTYSVYVYKTPDSVIATDGDSIQDTYSWSFITGTGILSDPDTGGVPSGTAPSGVADPSGILPISTIPSSLSVYSTTPKNMEPNIQTSLSSINIAFNTFLYSNNISGYITITEKGVLE